MSEYTGSSLLPGKTITPVVATDEIQIQNQSINQISQDYKESSHKSIATSKALYEAFTDMKSAIDEIDPDNNFFKDNSVITQSIIHPTFNKIDELDLRGWTPVDNKLVYSNVGEGNDNFCHIPVYQFKFGGWHYIKITIDRIDTGKLILYNSDMETIREFDVKGTYLFVYYVENPDIESLRLVSENLYPNEVAIISYLGIYHVTNRLYDYLALYLKDFVSESGVPASFAQMVEAFKVTTNLSIIELTDQIKICNDATDIHDTKIGQLTTQLTTHTHTPASIGAASVTHTHEPEECGAAKEDHVHDFSSLDVSLKDHTHTPGQCGAAPEEHNHDDVYVTKSMYAFEQDNVNKLLQSLGGGGVGSTTGPSDVLEEPLTITNVHPDNKAAPVIYKSKSTSKSYVRSNPPLNMAEQKSSPTIATIRGNALLHTANSTWDLHSGVMETPNDCNSWILQDFEIHEVVQDKLTTQRTSNVPLFTEAYTNSDLNRRDKGHPLFRYKFSTLGNFKFLYKFHTPQTLTSVRFEYDQKTDNWLNYSTTKPVFTQLTNDVALGINNSGMIKKGKIITYRNYVKTKEISFDTFNLLSDPTQFTNMLDGYFDISLIDNPEVDSYEIIVEDVYPFFADLIDEEVWSLKVSPILTGNTNTISIRPDNTFIGYIEALSGVNDVTLELPKTLSVDMSKLGGINSQYSVILGIDKALELNQGKYSTTIYLSPFGVDVTPGLPTGELMLAQGVGINRWNWGNVNLPVPLVEYNSDSTVFTESNYHVGVGDIEFTHAQAVVGFDIVLNKSFDKPIKLVLMNKNNVVVFNKTIPVNMLSSISDHFSNEDNKTYYTCSFEKVYTDITRIELTVNDTVWFYSPRLVGVHYDPTTKKIYDYHKNMTPVCALGKVQVVSQYKGTDKPLVSRLMACNILQNNQDMFPYISNQTNKKKLVTTDGLDLSGPYVTITPKLYSTYTKTLLLSEYTEGTTTLQTNMKNFICEEDRGVLYFGWDREGNVPLPVETDLDNWGMMFK